MVPAMAEASSTSSRVKPRRAVLRPELCMVASLSPAAGPSTAGAAAPAKAAATARSSTAGAASSAATATATSGPTAAHAAAHATHAATALCAHVAAGSAAHGLVGAGQRLGVSAAAAPGRVHDQLRQGDADLVTAPVGLADR